MIVYPVPAVEKIPHHLYLHKARLGMLTNEAAITIEGQPSRQYLLDKGYTIIRLFSQEHGLLANQPDGAKVGDEMDNLTGLPVVSLYGENLKPAMDQLEGLDAVLFDIPDVGCRFYTYLWSMTYMMEACTEAGLPFIVLDRPNPIGGNLMLAEGPMLDEANCASFIGRWSIPIRHCCTLGELALYFQATRLPALKLEVIPCANWNRNKVFLEAGYTFTPTSPAITDAETALLYPGTGLLEGIYISEGRGTAAPFKQAGAPWIHSEKWKDAIENTEIKGVDITENRFVPEWGLYKGEVCNGLSFKVINPSIFRPVEFGIQLISQLMVCFPNEVQPRLYQTIANPTGANHLDRLLGVKDSFTQLSGGNLYRTACIDWQKTISPYLLYA
jgi:uncharacterized protein YbbC (DUF1343 family)